MLRFDSSRRSPRNYFSRREQWRLLLLVMSLGVVILLMRAVRRPENVARVAEAFTEPDSAQNAEQAGALIEKPESPRIRDSFHEVSSTSESSVANGAARPTVDAPNLTKVLSLAGWTPDRFSGFADNEPLTDAERDELVQLLWRVRTFDAGSIEAWAQESVSLDALRANPEHRGAMVHFAARAVTVERHELSSHDAARLEMPAYYTCDLDIEDDGRARVFALDVPDAWENLEPLDEPVTVSGLFLKHLPSDDAASAAGKPIHLIVAKRIAWHPTTAREPVVSFGKSVLGTLGMDVGLFDDVRSHGPIRAAEREAFYQLFDAVGGIGANQLARFAQSNLNRFRRQWKTEMTAKDARRRVLAQEVVRRADEGRYSVAPLFNDAKRQIGQLVVVEGAARRVVRIDVGSRSDGRGPTDIARRFGFDHYYEVEIFTDDSQNYPLVFCVRELPAGFPMGEALHVPVRIAGFFFKAWQYTTRGTRDSETGDVVAGSGRPQYAPLLVGRAPLLLRMEPAGSELARLVGGGLFLLALGGIWAAAWWFARADRKFAEKTPAAGFNLPPGESLNELNLEVSDEPINIGSGIRRNSDGIGSN